MNDNNCDEYYFSETNEGKPSLPGEGTLYARFDHLKQVKKEITNDCSKGIICSFIYCIPFDFTFEIFLNEKWNMDTFPFYLCQISELNESCISKEDW